MRVESLSSLQVFKDCPRAYHYQYREQIEPAYQSSHMRRGSYVDKILSTALQENNFPVNDLSFLTMPETKWEDSPENAAEDWIVSLSIARRVFNFIRDQGWTTCTYKELGLVSQEIEQCVQVRLAAQGMQGIIDWIARDRKGRICLVDFKVSKIRPVLNETMIDDRQLGFYGWLLRQQGFQNPFRLYQLRIFGECPQTPKIVKHKNSTKKNPRCRPETGKLNTTWEMWKNVALDCDEDPDAEDYTELRQYLEALTWQCFVACLCPEEDQDRIAKEELLWKQQIENSPALRNYRTYRNSPCNMFSSSSQRCKFIEPCLSELQGDKGY